MGGRHTSGVLRQIRWSSIDPGVCIACRQTIHRRSYASSAAAAAVETPTTLLNHIPPVTQATSPQPSYAVKTGVVLARAPLLTRDLDSFEKASFFYQKRLNERLTLPFTRYLYFKKDTPADLEWKRKQRLRQTPARDIGAYNPYTKEGWNDELLVGASESDPEKQVEALLDDAASPGVGSGEMGEAKKDTVERPQSRVTEADRLGDMKSLSRRLDRTLYMLIQEDQGRWRFPAAPLVGKESLHQAAERILVQSGGLDMNTWVVGNHPIGHFKFHYPLPRLLPEKGIKEKGEKTFFMKARIMAGQANLKNNALGWRDVKWLCKEEVQQSVTAGYWSAVKNMLGDR
ncbi:MAG: 54S ribosomal protein L17 mitochondrial [Caeruleum heppii]|nr:MAG: 54S ribosomal protein L17 mitochondrial [Caeruleum heppii]